MTKPIAQYRAVLRAGGERPLIAGLTYASIAHTLDAPRSSTRPRGVLGTWRANIEASTPTASVMTAHIVEPSYVKLGWRHKPTQRNPLVFTLSRRTLSLVRWRAIVAQAQARRWGRYGPRQTPYEALVDGAVAGERERARIAAGELEVLDIALRGLRRLVKERARARTGDRTKAQDAARKRAERAAMRQRVMSMSVQADRNTMRAELSARAYAAGMVTND